MHRLIAAILAVFAWLAFPFGLSALDTEEPLRMRLQDLPEREEVQIPARVADLLADVEKVAGLLPGMDRKKAYLITLPLENHLKDVVLSANRPAVLHPRAMAWLIGAQAAGGAKKNEISRLLVNNYQKELFEKTPLMMANEASLDSGAPAAEPEGQ